jgi:hypothetical protein
MEKDLIVREAGGREPLVRRALKMITIKSKTWGMVLSSLLMAAVSGCYDRSLCELVNDPAWCDATTLASRPIPAIGDADGDGIADRRDNCPDVANADQADADGDGAGDLCDATPNGPDQPQPDTDGDALPDDADNCPDVANADQADLDADGVGDACDPDADGDGVEGPLGLNQDCDDGNPAVFPGQAEDCFNGLDDDCDGNIDIMDADCGCPYACGDLDGSGGVVDANDFAILSTCWNLAGPSGDCDLLEFKCSDLDNSGAVDLSDFSTFASVFGGSSTNSIPNCP